MFRAYRELFETRAALTAKRDLLVQSAARRRRRRMREGAPTRDKALALIRANLRRLEPRYIELRERLANIAFSVAENYWPRFFRYRPGTDGTEATACPATERDDCIQAAAIRVVAVAHRYDGSRGSLLGFITQVCKNEFLGVIRRVQQRQVNHLRHVDRVGLAGEASVRCAGFPAVSVIVCGEVERPVSVYASFGEGDDTVEVRFASRPRRLDTPSAAPFGRFVGLAFQPG